MNKRLNNFIVSFMLLFGTTLLGGCDLKEALCTFLGDSCSDVRPSEDPAQFGPPPPPAAVEAVFLTPPPSMVVAGEAWPDVVVELRNAFGERTENTSSVTVTLSHDGSSDFFLDAGTLKTNNGLATFSGLQYGVAETLHISASGSGLSSPLSTTVTVLPASPDHLSVTNSPSSAVIAGDTWPNVEVQIVDFYGNLTDADDVLVGLSVMEGMGSLNGTVEVSSVAGSVTFNDLSYEVAEIVGVLAEVEGGGIDSAGFSVTVDAAPVMELAFNIPDGTTTQVDLPISVLAVDVVDAFGNRVLSAPDVDVALTHTGTGILSAASGTTARTTIQGRAIFDDLSYDTIESLNLTASALGFDPVTVMNFTVQGGAPDGLTEMVISLDEMGMTIKGEEPDISADGRFVSFVSEVNGGGGVFYDIYRRDMVLGTSALLLDDDEGAGRSREPRMSADGRLLAYRHYNPSNILLDVASSMEIAFPWGGFGDLSSNGRYIIGSSSASAYAKVLDPWLGSDLDINAHVGVVVFNLSISQCGRYLAFTTQAENVVPEDMNGVGDVFILDRDLDGDEVFDKIGETSITMVSVASDGSVSDGYSSDPILSRSGRYVVFTSWSTTFDARTDGDEPHVYIHDRDVSGNGTFDEPGDIKTELITEDDMGVLIPGSSLHGAGVSDDGRFVMFRKSNAVWIHDRDVSGDGTPDELGDIASAWAAGGSNLRDPVLSRDGRYVVYSVSDYTYERLVKLTPNPLYPFPAP